MYSTPTSRDDTDLPSADSCAIDIDALEEPCAAVSVATATSTHPCDGVPIYPHGISVRVVIDVRGNELKDKLATVGYPLDGPAWRTWTSHGRRRHCMRGSKWLTERIAKTRRLPLHRANRDWRTRLFNVAFDIASGPIFLDLQGTRIDADVRRLVEDVLGFHVDQWRILHYRRAERYIVLMPHEAYRLAESLGTKPCRGNGRLARKRWLARDHEIPITIRHRTNGVAKLSVYRINNGATSPFKCEVVLQGKTSGRQQFGEKDIGKLDAILLDLVVRHDLHPICKPARWEPYTGRTAVDRGNFDISLKKIGWSAYRGCKPATEGIQEVVRVCHTPSEVEVISFAHESQGEGYPPSPRSRIRFESHPHPHHPILDDGSHPHPHPHHPIVDDGSLPDGIPSRHHDAMKLSIRSSSPGRHLGWTLVEGGPLVPSLYRSHLPEDVEPLWHPDPYDRLASELALLRGTLSEVVLDPEVDPGSFLGALERHLDDFAVISIAHPWNAWQSVIDAARRHPGDDDTMTVVLVIDPTAACVVESAVSVWDDDSGRMLPGPLVRSDVAWVQDAFALTTKATAAWLWDLLRGLREEVCDLSGGRVIVVTVDARPDHGRGPLLRSHCFRDGRVRSSIGDAGRYWAHQRYYVEPGRHGRARRVVAWKDEAEGLTGREL